MQNDEVTETKAGNGLSSVNLRETFDAEAALAAHAADAPHAVRKLTFASQCGAFAALYAGVPNKVVSRAFGISPQTTSLLNGCMEYDPDPYRLEYQTGINPATKKFHNQDKEMPIRVLMDHNRNRKDGRQRRYENVWREFEALGKEEFNRRYYTPRIDKMITLAEIELKNEKRK